MFSALVVVLTLLLFLPQDVFVASYNWTITAAPRQCANLSISASGDILPPLKALVVPIGPSPLNFEVRKVIEVPFGSTTATNVSFQLPYPTGSKFNAFVTDATGYGHGQAGFIWTVESSDDSSCFDSTKNATPPFTFALSPPNLAECKDVTIYWNSSSVQGTPSFIALVPGSGYWDISPAKIIPLPNNLGVGYTWRNPVPPTIDVVIVGGDNRGMGSGGFINSVVEQGDPRRDSNGNCNGTDTGGDNKVNVGAIVGGVIAALVLLGFALFFLWWFLRQKRRKAKPRIVDPGMQTTRPGPLPFIIEGNDSNNNSSLYGQPASTRQPRLEPDFGTEMETRVQQPPAYSSANPHYQAENVSVPSVNVSDHRVSPKSPGLFVHTTSGTEGPDVTGDGIGTDASMHLTWDGRN